MIVFSIISTISSFIELLLRPWLHTNYAGMLFSDFKAYTNGHPLISLSFNVGLLLAMLVYSRKDIQLICKEALLKMRQPNSIRADMLKNFCIMSIPAIMVFAGRRYIFSLLPLEWRAFFAFPWAIIFVVAIIMLCCDLKENTDKQMTRKDAAIIGFSQLLALIPGTYRLDFSFIAMRALGFSRVASLQNFILLSIPFQVCVCIKAAVKCWPHMSHLAGVDVLWAIIGGVAVFGVDLTFLHFANWFLKKFTLLIFVLYRIVTVISFFVYAYPQVVKFAPTTTTEKMMCWAMCLNKCKRRSFQIKLCYSIPLPIGA